MAEGTPEKKVVDPEREALIAEMLRDAKREELPSELTKNPVISDGLLTEGAPTIVKEVSSGGYVWVWDSRTGEKLPVLYYRLGEVLRYRRPDGSYRFATTDPGIMPKRGTVKCMLHQDSPNRAKYDELGFRTCRKSNIINQFQLQRHMALKHPMEWKTIEEDKKERERKEDRDLQKMLALSLTAKAIGPTVSSAFLPQPSDQPKEEPVQVVRKEGLACPKCGKSFSYKRAFKNHVKNCK